MLIADIAWAMQCMMANVIYNHYKHQNFVLISILPFLFLVSPLYMKFVSLYLPSVDIFVLQFSVIPYSVAMSSQKPYD